MSNRVEIKHYKVKSILDVIVPNSVFYVKGDNDSVVKTYITDLLGAPYPLQDLTGGSGGSGITTLTSIDGSVEITGTASNKNIQLSSTLQSLINSALQSGDPISSLINDSGYITLSDIPLFNPLDYDLEDFSNLSVDPFSHISEIPTTTSELTNDSGFITTETDPVFSAWLLTNPIPTLTSQLTNNSGFLTQQEVLEYTNLASFPIIGTLGTVYIALDTGLFYSWNGVAYVLASTPNTGITGVGITNYTGRWTSPTTLGIGVIRDNGTGVGINGAPLGGYSLNVIGNTNITNFLYANVIVPATAIIYDGGGNLGHRTRGGTNVDYFAKGSAPSHGNITFGDGNYVTVGNETARFDTYDRRLGIRTTTPTEALDINGNIRNRGFYYDYNNDAGSPGQVLSSTALGTDWIDITSGGVATVTGTGVDNTDPLNPIVNTPTATDIDALKRDGSNANTDVNIGGNNFFANGIKSDGNNVLTEVSTTASLAPSTDRNYVTDAQLVVVGNTSNTNSGDNATNTQYSGLSASKEDVANKTNTMVGNTASSEKYLSAKGVYDYIVSLAYLTIASASATYQVILTETVFGTFLNSLSVKTTPLDADLINIIDTADSNKAKKVTFTNVKAFLKTYFDTIYTTTSAVATQITTALSGYALLASPSFIGSPTAPTQSQGDNSTKLATTAYVDTALSNLQKDYTKQFLTMGA